MTGNKKQQARETILLILKSSHLELLEDEERMPRIGKCLVMEAGGRGGEAAVLLAMEPEAGQAARHAEVEAAAAARVGPAQVFHPLRPFPPLPNAAFFYF